MSKQADCFECRRCFCVNDRHLLGSSNGLVCVSPSPNEILVLNPSTREVKKIIKPQIPVTDSLCSGFGYDSKNDDYKIILGVGNGECRTCFQVFSLRSDIWKVITEIDYVFTSRAGMLCEGALHWLAYDTSTKKKNAILSFHFSDEKFLEVPTPDDVTYNELYIGQPFLMRLGTMDGHLCLFRFTGFNNIWVMNKERSWDKFGTELEIKNDAVHLIKQLKNYIPYKRPLCHQTLSRDYQLVRHRMFFGTPLFVESLVSPHFHKKAQRKRQAMSAIKRPK
ncbi:F-box/kelch-repeat protein At3g06240-like, partial [Bidens hawaiensis]|uniref:F-box/kelch-repeat protein At3g06240-like n=1 Tax=Bidens hawaiensis TaxID=980011 RepID=UPI00404966CD